MKCNKVTGIHCDPAPNSYAHVCIHARYRTFPLRTRVYAFYAPSLQPNPKTQTIRSPTNAIRLRVTRASRGRISPPRQSIRQIRDIARSRTCRFAQVSRLGNEARVVAARGAIGAVVVVEVLHQAVASRSALSTILDHVPDGLVGMLGVELGTVVGLHDTRVRNAVVCLLHTGAAG